LGIIEDPGSSIEGGGAFINPRGKTVDQKTRHLYLNGVFISD